MIVKAELPIKTGLYKPVSNQAYCWEEFRQGLDGELIVVLVNTPTLPCERSGVMVKFQCKKNPDSFLFCENKVSDELTNQLTFINDSSALQRIVRSGRTELEVLFELAPTVVSP